MWLQTRLYLLVGLMLAIIYAVIVLVGRAIGIDSFVSYAILAAFFVLLQYMIGPSMVSWTMRVKYLSEKEYPELQEMVAELANSAGIPKPRVGISRVPIPNAFAFGRTIRDARVCVTEALFRSLSKDELKAVLGHEISHIKHRDMALITILSVFPLILYFIAWGLMWSGGGRRSGGGQGNILPLIGLGMMVLYFIANLLVLYGSRIREYYADLGSIRLGNHPSHLASALYKLVYWNARAPKEELSRVQGIKAFFVNDPSRALLEVRELSQIDSDMSGTISHEELLALRSKEVRIGAGEKLMEAMSTHPNMLKRIKHLSSLA